MQEKQVQFTVYKAEVQPTSKSYFLTSGLSYSLSFLLKSVLELLNPKDWNPALSLIEERFKVGLIYKGFEISADT